jgi:hypothetical protein
MAFNKHDNANNGINEEQIASFLSDALSRVETDSDPETLNQLKKIYKKNIPFSRRMYVAAWLVKQATNGGYRGASRFGRNDRNDRFSRDHNDRGEQRNDRQSRFEERRAERTERPDRADRPARSERAERPDRAAAEHTDDHADRAPRVQIDPSLATTIFIGIGRNRRVYPRDLVGLLVSVAGLDRERIGDIRVLANYSFIQLFTEDCEKAIAALNGYDYRGRKLSVSYSRQKEEGEGDGASAETASNPSVAENEPPADETSVSLSEANKPAPEAAPEEERIPADVRNDSHAVHTESNEEAQIAAAQSAFAAQQKAAAAKPAEPQTPFTETTDDGQVKSHFSSGDSNYLV